MTDNWGTPQKLFDILNDEFHFDLDVCASVENAKCSRFFTREVDGLAQEWTGTFWMNPPYGREIINWMKKAHEAAEEVGATGVCLIPVRSSSPWWHQYVHKAAELRFVERKVSFTGEIKGVPFWGSAVVVFRKGDHSVRVSSQRQR